MKEQDYIQLTLFQGDFPVNLSVLPENEEARMMTVTSGRKCLESYPRSGPLGLLAKMLLESSIWHSTKCYLTWKIKVTKHNHFLFQLAVRTLRTEGTESLLWLMIPNVQSSPKGRSEKFRGKNKAPMPEEYVQMWSTPRANSSKSPCICGEGGMDLQTLEQMFPTPTTGAGLCGGSGNYRQLENLTKQGVITEEERRNMSQGNGGQLNPTWVEWLMGFPLGWTDLDA